MTMTADHQRQGADTNAQDAGHSDRSMYLRFGAMIATSIVVMYLVTYLNVVDIAHVHFSEERVYMALTMGGAMGVVMMAWMWSMYADRRWNIGIIAGAVLLGVVATFLSVAAARRGRQLHARHDPPPLDRHPDQRAGGHQGRAGARAGRRDHRGPAARDR
jgi:hypothetical protein